MRMIMDAVGADIGSQSSQSRFPLPDSRGCWPTGNDRSLQRVGADAMTLGLAAGWLLRCLATRIEGAHLVDECPDWTQWSIQLRTGRLVLHHQRATRPSNCRHGRARTVGARASGMT